MRVDAHEADSEPPELSLFEAMERFEESREHFLEQCEVYSSSSSQENLDHVVESAKKTVDPMAKIMLAAWEDETIDTDEKAALFADAIKSDDERRVAYLEGLVGKKGVFLSVAERDILIEDVKNRFNHYEFDIEDYIKSMKQNYETTLNSDITQFVSEVDFFDPTPKERAIEAARIFGEHALDVAKISVGAGVGVWVGNELQRRRKKK